MPAEGEVGGVADLLQRFLDAVFSEVDLAGGGRRTDVGGRAGLRDGDEADLVGPPACPTSRAGDTLADVGQARGNLGVGRVGAYFFSCETIAFAVAAYWPSGASCR
jgi:hypothetical protein